MTIAQLPDGLNAALLEASPDCVKVLDLDGRLAFINPAGCARLGVTDGDTLVGSLWETLWPARARAVVRSAVARGARGGAVRFQAECPTLAGVARWWDVTVSPVREGDAVACILAVSRDITELKAAELALRDSEERQRLLLEAAQEGICTADAAGIVTYANPRMGEILGAPASALIGRSIFECIAPSAVDAARDRFARRTLGTADSLGPSHDIPFSRMDGTGVWLRVTAGPLPGADGGVGGVVYLASDVTAEHAAKDELARSERYYRALIERASEMIAVLSPEGCILYATPAWLALLGYTPDEVVGLNAMTLIHPEDLALVSGTLERVATTLGSSANVEYRAIRKDGTTCVLHSIGRNLLDDEAVRGIVVNSYDVTEQRRLAAQLRQAQKMEAVGQLTAGIAHDFNNLLQVISGNAYFARDSVPPDSSAAADLAQIQSAAERAASLTRQLLAFSRQQVLHPTPVELDDIVARMQEMLERTLGEHIALTTQLDGGVIVNADRHQLEQVIMNLAVNARDAMPDGGVLLIETHRVHVDQAHEDASAGVAPGEYGALVVRDTGTGMDAETRTRIFEPFFTTKPLGAGTGLGLSMVHGIVHQSGGSISVDSTPGFGTAFTVLLPCADAPEQSRSDDVPSVAGGGSETVLLAEDDAAVRATVRRLLEEAGYSVIEAKDGGEVVARLDGDTERAIQLLVTDAVMPDAGALDVIEIAQQLRPGLPILVISGHSADLVDPRGELGADVLSKPFTPDELLRRVRAALDARARR